MKEQLIQQAESQLSAYPQYKGHWNNWVVVKVLKTIKTKLGVAFHAGDLVLANPILRTNEYVRRNPKRFVTCYSFRNQCDTSVPLSNVDFNGVAKDANNERQRKS